MPLPKSEAVVKYGSSIDVHRVTIEDIMPCKEEKDLPGGGKIKFPYSISFVDEDEDSIQTVNTTRTMRANNWSSKFYLNKKGYISFSANNELLAIMEILKATKHKLVKNLEEGEEFDLNDLISVEFEAAIGTYEDTRFIDWVNTFRHNGVEVPDLKEKSATKVSIDDEDDEDSESNEALAKDVFGSDDEEDEKPAKKVKKQVSLDEDDEEDEDEDEEEDIRRPKKKK